MAELVRPNSSKPPDADQEGLQDARTSSQVELGGSLNRLTVAIMHFAGPAGTIFVCV